MKQRFQVGDIIESACNGRVFQSEVYDVRRLTPFDRKYLLVQLPWMTDKIWWNPKWCSLAERKEEDGR